MSSEAVRGGGGRDRIEEREREEQDCQNDSHGEEASHSNPETVRCSARWQITDVDQTSTQQTGPRQRQQTKRKSNKPNQKKTQKPHSLGTMRSQAKRTPHRTQGACDGGRKQRGEAGGATHKALLTASETAPEMRRNDVFHG